MKKTICLLLTCMVMGFLQLNAQKQNSDKGLSEKEKYLKSLNEQQNQKEENPFQLETMIQSKSSDYVITAEHVSSLTGTRHVYIRQAIEGIEIAGTESSVHVGKNGKIIQTHNNFVRNVQQTVNNRTASLSADQAINAVARQMGYKVENLDLIEKEEGVGRKALYNKAGISNENIPVKLMYYFRENYGTLLVWELSVSELNTSDWWNFRVDASTGQIIDKYNFTQNCDVMGDHSNHNHEEDTAAMEVSLRPAEYPLNVNTASTAMMSGTYNVYPMPMESPYDGARQVLVNPENVTASPFGWLDTDGVVGAEFTITRGNNVYAYEDRNGDNIPGFSPDGGASLDFDFPLDLNDNPVNSESAIISNLFYWNNIIHDVMYFYGFDEASGNFQENNYGNGGAGSDSVNAEAQNAGNCNANFGTPADGSNPRMQMFLCNNTIPSRDSDLDNLVIVHEYAHGITNRLTGGAANVGCLGNNEQMGEGWSDFYGYMLTMKAGETGTDSRPVGNYLFGQPDNGPGIRPFPYNTDMAVNPQTYDDIKTAIIPHGVGSVWATMLFDMTWGLIDVYGFDPDFYNGTGGNNIAIQLVTEALKLQPCSPGFVDGRDAILAADQLLYGGANECVIWGAFAKRGLGFSADQGLSSSRLDGTEAFDLPPSLISFDTVEEVCLAGGVVTGLSGGLPAGGVYSGPGVTDDGNGTTYTFDPSVNGAGNATITYEYTCSTNPISETDTILVTNEPPVIVCAGTIFTPATFSDSQTPALAIPDNNPTGVSSTLSITENFSITDLNVDVNVSHNWVGDIIVTIESPAGTTATIIDRPGYTGSGFGCDENDIIATLDDDATDSVENECEAAVPTINGTFIPNNPLSVFNGENVTGDWIITVSDNASADTGTLNEWALHFSYDEISQVPLDYSLDTNGFLSINAEDLVTSVTVSCGGYTVTAGNPPAPTVDLSCLDIGENTIDVVVTDDGGTSSTCSVIINVIDNIPPVISCTSNKTADTSAGVCTYTHLGNLWDASYDDNCTATLSYELTGATTGTGNTLNGVTFNLGVTTVTWTVTDPGNNTDMCSYTVTVEDNEAPEVTCITAATVETDAGVCNYTHNGTGWDATATDNCSLSTLTYVLSGGATGTGTSLDGVTFNLGTTTVVWTATDAEGNSESCTTTITVEDTEAPVIICISSKLRDTDPGECTYTHSGSLWDSLASDNCNVSSLTYELSGATTGNGTTLDGQTFNLGTTTVVWTVIDDAGNTDVCTYTVTIEDNEAPVVSCTGNQSVDTDTDVCTYTHSGTAWDATATDNCG
ncbi:M36 family metallopeptidase, partial [uncultured Planktosalinus sp.]|uniref:M36 family metallopeptidase n=1 Tax=uncultured Planktosalinus sp. TaxID=1810935 RepID=UPI0030D8F537